MILTTPESAPLLAALHALCFGRGKHGGEHSSECWDEPAMRALLEAGSVGCVVGAGAESDPPAGLGLIRVAADEAELLTLGVLPEARRQGVGRRLLDALATEAARRGAARLLLEVSQANAPAQALYAGVGFVQVGRRRRYYPDGSDALVLAQDLDQELAQDRAEGRARFSAA